MKEQIQELIDKGIEPKQALDIVKKISEYSFIEGGYNQYYEPIGREYLNTLSFEEWFEEAIIN